MQGVEDGEGMVNYKCNFIIYEYQLKYSIPQMCQTFLSAFVEKILAGPFPEQNE